MAYLPGPGNACSEASQSNFAAPKMRIWSHNRAGYSFPSEGDGMGRLGGKNPGESPQGQAGFSKPGGRMGMRGNHCIFCCTNTRALWECWPVRICGAQAWGKLMGGWGVMAVPLPPPTCCHGQLPNSPLPKVCLLHIRLYTQSGP